MNIWLSSLRIRAHLSWRTGKHLHVLHVLRTYPTCSYPGYQDTTTYAALLTGRLPLWLLQHHQGDDSILNQAHTTLSVTRSFRIWKDLRVLHFVLLSHCHSIFNIITGWCCLIILFCIVVICILSAACIFLTLLFFSWVVLARNSAIGIVRNIIFHWRLIMAPACISQFLCCQQAT